MDDLARRALEVFAVAPQALGGVRLRAAPGPARDAWLDALRAYLPPDAPWRRLPSGADDAALRGGLDLSATLAAQRPVMRPGLLAQTAGGVVLAAMAERLSDHTAALLAAALDDESHPLAVVALDEGVDEDEAPPASLVERLALSVEMQGRDAKAGDVRAALNASDESYATSTRVDGQTSIGSLAARRLANDEARIQRARSRWREVQADDVFITALVQAAMALGVHSARAACHALTVARIVAALDARDAVDTDDAAWAARLVLAPRATQKPLLNDTPPEPSEEEVEPNEPQHEEPQDVEPQAQADPTPPDPSHDNSANDDVRHDPADASGPNTDPTVDTSVDTSVDTTSDKTIDDHVLAAAAAVIPAGLLALLAAGRTPASRQGRAGRAGDLAASRSRGRVIGSVRGQPQGGARLALVDTLRAAAPWQRARAAMHRNSEAAARSTEATTGASTGTRAGTKEGNTSGTSGTSASTASTASTANTANTANTARGATALRGVRVRVERDDLRVQRRVQRRSTTTIFALDASGSQALHRLAEAKGAVELLLADCYARRDRVAVIAFRGTQAAVMLAPTRSLVRARRELAGLPGGGGTPLAAGIDASHALALAVRRSGATPLIVLLTDGRANVARDGSPGRDAARQDAQRSARALRAAHVATLVIDTSPQPGAPAQTLAAELGARCIALPHAQAHAVSLAVKAERGRQRTPGRA